MRKRSSWHDLVSSELKRCSLPCCHSSAFVHVFLQSHLSSSASVVCLDPIRFLQILRNHSAAPATAAAVPAPALVSTASLSAADITLLRSCLSAAVFDSSPVDFTAQLGVRFLSQPQAPASGSDAGTALGGTLRLAAVRLGAALLTATVHAEFERQRAAQWQALVALAVSDGDAWQG